MKKPLIAGITLAASLSAGSLLAALSDEDFRFDTTEDLYQVCSTPESAAEYHIAHFACRAFIEATVQYHDGVSDRQKMKRLICYPKDATIADGQKAFVSWAKANAGNKKLMAEQPVVGLVRALASTYPCR